MRSTCRDTLQAPDGLKRTVAGPSTAPGGSVNSARACPRCSMRVWSQVLGAWVIVLGSNAIWRPRWAVIGLCSVRTFLARMRFALAITSLDEVDSPQRMGRAAGRRRGRVDLRRPARGGHPNTL